jgi:hypothetical protein
MKYSWKFGHFDFTSVIVSFNYSKCNSEEFEMLSVLRFDFSLPSTQRKKDRTKEVRRP